LGHRKIQVGWIQTRGDYTVFDIKRHWNMSRNDAFIQEVLRRRPVLLAAQAEVEGSVPVLLGLPGDIGKKVPALNLGFEGIDSQSG